MTGARPRPNSPSRSWRRWSDEPNPGRGAAQAFEQPGRFAQPRHIPGVGDHRLADTLVLLDRLLGVAVEIGARGLQPLGLGLRRCFRFSHLLLLYIVELRGLDCPRRKSPKQFVVPVEM